MNTCSALLINSICLKLGLVSPFAVFFSGWPAGKSLEELQQMRAKELKSALAAASVKVDDCFEKSQLIQRALEASK